MSSSFFKGDKDYTEKTRCIDLMLEQFSEDRNKILKMLKENPDLLVKKLWSNESPICKDESCLFQMGKTLSLSVDDILEKHANSCDSLANFYICPQCKNMKRIIDLTGGKRTKSDEPFMLECGEKAGMSLYYDEKNISRLYLDKEKEPDSVKKAYKIKTIKKLARCSSASCALPSKAAGEKLLEKYAKIDYLGSDKFTNNMLINWYLNSELKKMKITNIIDMFISFICNDNGYNVYEYLDIGNVTSFQNFPEFLETSGKPSPTAKADDKTSIHKDVVLGIIVQLFSVLHYLRNYDFSHGNPNTDTIKFNKEVVSYIYDGVHISSPVTLKLLDFSTSSCTVDEKLRLYSKNVVADEQLKKKNFDPILDTIEGKVMVYRLKDPRKNIKSTVLYNYIKHLGLPIYSASFDAYAFMLVLMSEKSFYLTCLENSKLSNFWRNMWVEKKDFETISSRLEEIHENVISVNYDDILILLSGLSLRCDMIDHGWSLIKSF
jgi:hypothetical protein